MGTIERWIGATLFLAVLTQLVRYLFFKRASGYVRAVLPVLPAWLLSMLLSVLGRAEAPGTIGELADWARAVDGYTVPAIAVAIGFALVEWRKRRRVLAPTPQHP